MLPPPVIALIESAFPGGDLREITPTIGGFSNLTATVTIGSWRCVVKAANNPLKQADVRHEAQMLTVLRDSGLPVAHLLTLVEDGEWTVEILRAVAGDNGLQVYANKPDTLGEVYSALGYLLAHVHNTAIAPIGPDFLLAERARRLRSMLPALPLDSALQEILSESLTHPAWSLDSVCLVHGDAGIHNLLWNGNIVALLDWEWAGWGNPLLDLAWIFWTMRFRSMPATLWDTFLAAYSSRPATARGGSPQELRALTLGQVANILVRAHHNPAAWEEWLRRLRWTLALDFPAIRRTPTFPPPAPSQSRGLPPTD